MASVIANFGVAFSKFLRVALLFVVFFFILLGLALPVLSKLSSLFFSGWW